MREAYYLGEAGNKAETYRQTLPYYPYYGRGYVQLTWKRNYEFYGLLLERDLLTQPEQALDPMVSLFILVHGFKTGAFTGHSLTEFVHAGGQDFVNARRCINGLDKAEPIAGLARNFLEQGALLAA